MFANHSVASNVYAVKSRNIRHSIVGCYEVSMILLSFCDKVVSLSNVSIASISVNIQCVQKYTSVWCIVIIYSWFVWFCKIPNIGNKYSYKWALLSKIRHLVATQWMIQRISVFSKVLDFLLLFFCVCYFVCSENRYSHQYKHYNCVLGKSILNLFHRFYFSQPNLLV